tara:strand:+ start:61515 stop:62648 length:1134 start_codon:yes stop_codon:yes gene_type:complete
MEIQKVLRLIVKKFFNLKANNKIQRIKDDAIRDYLSSYVSQETNLINYFNKNKTFKNDLFKILDIGCAEGIDEYWNKISDAEAKGIDPIQTEINRLNKVNKFTKYNYYCYFVDTANKILSNKYNYNGEALDFKDTSAARGFEITSNKKIDYLEDRIHFKKDFQVTPSNISEKKVERISLTNFCKKYNFEDFNFLKIDTDGHSLNVLDSCEGLINNKQIIGIKVEVNFLDNHAYDFYLDVAHYLTKNNFQLVKVMANTYAPYELPDKFLYDIPAQSFNGFSAFGDLIFIKKINKEEIERMDKLTFLKFLALLELFNFNGLAIKLLNISENKFLDNSEKELFKNLLTKKVSKHIFNKEYSHKEFINKFYENFKMFFSKQ